jgi:putative two-component system response regulator
MMTNISTMVNPTVPIDIAVPPTAARRSPKTNPPRSLWSEKYTELIETAKIAIIDDEELTIDVVKCYLEQEGYRNFYQTSDSRQAIELISTSQPDIVLLDVMMPHVDGLEILAQMRATEELHHIPVIILTACTGTETKLQALERGLSDFLGKPVDPSELLLRLRNVLAVKAYQDHLANYSQELETQVQQRTKELVESRQRIVHCLARAAEFRDDDTGHHVIRVGKYVSVIARELGFDQRQADLLEQAAQLHDIGKIGIPDSVLLKQGKLEPGEFEVIKQHCSFGNEIIDPMSQGEFDTYKRHTEIGGKLLDVAGYPVMELAAVIAQSHHEKWNGSGYPLGLSGEDIPIEGRIAAVADVFDALSSKRPYKPAFPQEKCFQILEEGRGQHFDPNVLDAFFRACDQIIDVQNLYSNV